MRRGEDEGDDMGPVGSDYGDPGGFPQTPSPPRFLGPPTPKKNSSYGRPGNIPGPRSSFLGGVLGVSRLGPACGLLFPFFLGEKKGAILKRFPF